MSVSEDADEAIKAYDECAEAGEIQLIIRGTTVKQKVIESEAEIKAKADAREKAKAERAEAELIEAEAIAEASAAEAQKAQARVKALKPRTKKRAGVA